MTLESKICNNKNECSIATTGPPICEISTSTTTTTCGLWGFQWEILATTPGLYHITKLRKIITTTTNTNIATTTTTPTPTPTSTTTTTITWGDSGAPAYR